MKPQDGMTLTDLIGHFRKVFEDDHVNVEEVMDLMASYKSNRADWINHAKYDAHKYTRNLIDAGNGKYNLMVLCWGEGMGSSIHDHSNSHCFVKILDGKLKETIYEWPREDEDHMNVKNVTVYEPNGVTYMSDVIGLHRMENPSHTDPTVTLHLYIPAFDECCMFDERTGHRSKCKVTFWSKFGEKVDYKISGNGTKPESSSEPASQNATTVATK